jgi:hypothetical protein
MFAVSNPLPTSFVADFDSSRFAAVERYCSGGRKKLLLSDKKPLVVINKQGFLSS